MTPLHFPFFSYWWLYLAFAAGVVVLVSADLGIFHRKVHAVGFREAAIGTAIWAALAMLFCLGLYVFAKAQFAPPVGRRAGLEFLTGYLLEWSLSLDNMFVFVVIFGYFGVPARFQHRVLFYGILGALVFRATFIALGAVLLKYAWMVILFGAFLILTGARMLFSPERQIDLDRSRAIRFLRKLLPVSASHAGQSFFVRVSGKLLATPLLLTLACIEISDVLFAIDSVPAIFAVTREPLIVFTSNVFAILGLRSMYFLLAGALGVFHYLRYGLALVLIFVGLKMAWWNEATGGHFSLGISLAVIAGLLGGSIAISLRFPKRQPAPLHAE